MWKMRIKKMKDCQKKRDINLNSFIKAISDSPEDIHSFEAFVDISEFKGESS